MRTALVTGHLGFVGRHMKAELEQRGYLVKGWDLLDYDAVDLFRRSYREDYDLLVHCAYNVGGREQIDGKNTNLAKNLMLDAAMFEHAVHSGRVGHVLYFSSSAVYPVDFQDGRYPGVRLAEHHAMVSGGEDANGQMTPWPDADYGWAKMNGERLADMARANGVSVSVLRPFSGYGPDQSGAYPFPSIVRRAISGDLSVWGPPGQTRDFIHISDVVKGALAVVQTQAEWVSRPPAIEPVNLCTGIGTELGDLAEIARWKAIQGHERATYDEDKPTGVLYRVGDPTRMLTYYTPQITIEQGIEEAIGAYS